MTEIPQPEAPRPRLPLPPTLFAIALMIGVAALGFVQLFAAHMTRDPMGLASSMAVAAFLCLPVAAGLALVSGAPVRLVASERPVLMVLRCLAKAGFLLLVLTLEGPGHGAMFMEFTGYALAVIAAALFFHERAATRDQLALLGCFCATVGVLAMVTWPGYLMMWLHWKLVGAMVLLTLFIALTRRLAPGDGVASLLFWDSVITLIILGGLFAGGTIAWDGAPLNQAAGLVLAVVVGRVAWIKAYVHAPLSRLAPFEYLALPMLVGLGLLFGQTMPLPMTLGFIGVIPICGLLLLREIWLVRRADAKILESFD